MKAAELRTKLAEGLRADVSGKTTPIQRLSPFLQDLVTYLEEHEDVLGESQNSSNAATQLATAQTNSEHGEATNATD